MSKNINIKKLIIGSIIIFITILTIFLFTRKDIAYTDNAYLKSDIIIVRPKITGYITEVLVDDNQAVQAEQIIARIDDRDYKLKVMLEEAKVEAVTAKIDNITQILTIKELEINKASLEQNSAKVSFEVANNDLKRAESLIENKSISQQSLEKKRNLQNILKNDYAAADFNYKAAIIGKEITLSKLNEAKALLDNAKINLALAKLDLSYTSIKAPTNGTISRRSLQIGQLASPQTAIAYLVQNNIWVEANFKETKIGKMRPGQKAIIKVDSFDKTILKGKIDGLSPATGVEFSILPAENATGNFTKIVQRIPVKIIFDQNQDLSLLKSGLSCEVKVEF